MNKEEVVEATGIVQRMLQGLLAAVPNKGRPGSDARRAIGDLMARTMQSMYDGTLGPQLQHCCDLVRQTSNDLMPLSFVRENLLAETPRTLGATMIRNLSVNLLLAEQAFIIQGMTFESRQDVDALIAAVQDAFTAPEETTADTMDALSYRALVELRAAIINYLVSVGMPLPEMLVYQFNAPLPSLVIAQRLYGDASQYDKIRQDNKVVHPLFCPMVGQALSE